jgi:hypothetical protein
MLIDQFNMANMKDIFNNGVSFYPISYLIKLILKTVWEDCKKNLLIKFYGNVSV